MLFLMLLDDMLTPCDDIDPVAAIATARLVGEDDHSMMNLKLESESKTTPVSCTKLFSI